MIASSARGGLSEAAMFGRLRRRWHNLARAKPGKRFQNRYYGRRQRPSGALVKLAYVVLGTLLVIAGVALLPAPGPGALVIVLGAALLAEESLAVARVCDAAEVKIRAWLRWMRRSRKRA
jgi:hypothetical protein